MNSAAVRWRQLLAIVVLGGSFVVTLVGLTLASRQYGTIWLPIALAALSATLLAALPKRPTRDAAAVAMGCGAVVTWMLSEPSVAANPLPGIREVRLLLLVVCLASQLFSLGSFRSATARWAAFMVLMSWLIGFFSSPSGGSGGMIYVAIHSLGLSPDQADLAVTVVRKTIHFGFYGFLGWTGYRLGISLGVSRARAVLFGLGLTFLHACYDESRQTFFSNRTGSFWDVLLDMLGAAVLIGVSVWPPRRHKGAEESRRHGETAVQGPSEL